MPSAAIATTGRRTVTVRPGCGEPPLVDDLLDRAELAGERELDVGSQHGVLGERDRVVRPRAVDQRRRDEHHVAGTSAIWSKIADAPAVTLSRRRDRASGSAPPV